MTNSQRNAHLLMAAVVFGALIRYQDHTILYDTLHQVCLTISIQKRLQMNGTTNSVCNSQLVYDSK